MNEQNQEVLSDEDDDKITLDIRLPNGEIVERELSYDEICFWVSTGMYIAHGYHALVSIFMAEQMDQDATVEINPDDEPAIN